MKNKDIEKMLAAGKDRILPDESVKSRIADELGYTSSAPALAYAHGGVKTVSNKKRIAIIAAAAAVVMAIVIGIAVPLSLNNGSSPTNPFGNKFLQITDAESFYAYGAASVGALLSGNSDALTSLASVNARGSSVSANAGVRVLNSCAKPNANNALAYIAMPSAGTNSAATDEAVQTAERYMALVENLLGSGEITETVSVGTNGYEYTMTVSYTSRSEAKRRTAKRKKAMRSAASSLSGTASIPSKAYTKRKRKRTKRAAPWSLRRIRLRTNARS